MKSAGSMSHESIVKGFASLQSKIKDLDSIIKELTTKANTAEASVKDIAIKAIESSGKLQIFEKTKES